MNPVKAPSSSIRVDLLIFGGGIAGLWSLLRARQAGYSALLVENRALGGVQTLAAQGIIHGGTKYALGGRLSAAARAVGRMPARWRACLAGQGELDLRGVVVNADHQHLWSPPQVSARLAGFFGSRMMRGRVHVLTRDQRPAPLNRPEFAGAVYRLDEPVLDTASLVEVLLRQAASSVRRYEPGRLRLEVDRVQIDDLSILPRRILLTAGAGNQALLHQLGLSSPNMQRRPLQMVMVRGRLPSLYLHVLEADTKPRLTITSHEVAEGERVWYLGGNLAEKGVSRSAPDQIEAAQRELAVLLPWLDQSSLHWSTLVVDRAEAAMPGRRRPDDAYLHRHGKVLVAWPTKLALAPRLADLVLAALEDLPPSGDTVAFSPGPVPPRAPLPWECCTWS